MVGQRDVGVELDGDALAVVAAPAPSRQAPVAAAAVEGAVLQRGGDHLDVGRSSHQGQQGVGGRAGLCVGWGVCVDRRRCAAGRESGGEERRLLSLWWWCVCGGVGWGKKRTVRGSVSEMVRWSWSRATLIVLEYTAKAMCVYLRFGWFLDDVSPVDCLFFCFLVPLTLFSFSADGCYCCISVNPPCAYSPDIDVRSF
jgi:hypothetical protein